MSGKPYQSKLSPYQKEIMHAWYSRQTLSEIQAMLLNHGIDISLPGISLFIKRRKKRPDPHDQAPKSKRDYTKPRTAAKGTAKKPERPVILLLAILCEDQDRSSGDNDKDSQ